MTGDKVAIAHDYLTQRGGAERVVLAMARAFPNSPVYTTLFDPASTYPEFANIDVRVTWLDRVPMLRRFHRAALPLLALAVSTKTIDADYVIVSTSGWAHGYRTRGAKIVYCHSPARWLYQRDAYLRSNRWHPKSIAVKLMTPFLLRWDKRQADSAAAYFANSTVVSERIRAAYGIEAPVLHAPHSIDTQSPIEPVDLSLFGSDARPFYLCISRLLPYKNVDAIIQGLQAAGAPLVVVGAGPEARRLQGLAAGKVLMLKDIPDSQLRWLYSNCSAVVSASYEDYGLTPIEAAAFGKPAVVLRWGGFLDTIKEGTTGVYFDNPDADSIRAAIAESERIEWDPADIRAHAANFSEEVFAQRLLEVVRSRQSS